MKIAIYSQVRFIGPNGTYDLINSGDIGYVIEDYGDGSFEVEFSEIDGTTRALEVIPGHSLELILD